MKHFFFSLKPRERLMALAALLVAAALWSTSAWGRAREGWDAWQALEGLAQAQKATLAKEREVRADTAQAVQGLDSGHGFDQARLVAEAVNTTRAAGLNPNTESPKTTKSGKFAVHSLQLSCRKADMAGILRFYESVRTRAPYLALSQVSMTAERGGAGTVTFKATLTALELIGGVPGGPAGATEPAVATEPAGK
ncbi:MAG: hypothetical protein RIS38_1024 [Verrucomicrobiota bacterium]|jgi:hypothetical protein